MNEEQEFLKDIEQESVFDVLDAPLVPEEKQEDPEDPEIQPDEIKNRRHKRLEAKLEAEREANIILNARLSAIAEAKKSQDTPDYLASVEKLYGTDTPEAQTATELLKNALKSVGEDAERRAVERIREEREAEKAELKKEEAVLDTMLEELEDEYSIDLTSGKSEAMRKGFFTLLEKMSPKDSQGNVTAYADHHAVWEEYRSKIAKKPDTRAKDLAARTTIQSGASKESNLEDDSTLRYLRENNLI